MSLNFSNITELIDETVNTDNTTYPLDNKARDINIALDRVFAIIFETGGTWQFDDSNHADYPIITTDLVSGQRDYSFVTDEGGNLILDVQKVFVADENGLFREVTPVDVPSGAPANYYDGLNTGGQPNTYEKNATGIFLDPIPNYNQTNGLKVYISREGSYFTSTDTTKKPGFAGLFHEYLVMYPSYKFAVRNDLKKAETLKRDILEMENAIREHYKRREKDVVKTLRAVNTSSK